MMIEINKEKLNRMLTRVTAAALIIGLAAGYRAVNPGSDLTKKAAEDETAVAVMREVTDWGLSFSAEGQPPSGNATSEELAGYNAWYVGDTSKKTIYLTFDAGYENGYTETILDILAEQKVPAAFFLVGTYMKENPELVKRMAKEGHVVGNHTMNHPDMSKIVELTDFQKEITEVESLYEKITGEKMKKFYRPPQGKFSTQNLEMAKALGYKTIFWSLAYVDWYENQQPGREEALKKLLPRTHNGAVILLHSTSKTNAQILEELITKWKEEGYQFEALEKLGK